MTLPSRHMIRNSSPGGLRPSALPLSHGGSPQYWIFTSERGRNIFFFETWRPEWGSNPRSPTFQAGSFNHCTRAHASGNCSKNTCCKWMQHIQGKWDTSRKYEANSTGYGHDCSSRFNSRRPHHLWLGQRAKLANTTCWCCSSVGLISGWWHKRWVSNKSTPGECFLIAGRHIFSHIYT